MNKSVQIDPLNSPHPIPWNWMTSIAFSGGTPDRCGYYRSQSLVSPNGHYATYSRIQVQPAAHFTQSRVISALFVENLHTGSLQTIMASSPFADNPFTASESELAGTIAVLIPVAWSETGDRLLAREFESTFGSDAASDFAVVWDSRTNQTQTLAPSQINYSNAILMGWSQTYPDQVLFQAGIMGEPHWDFYTVKANGQTNLARGDRPVTYGQVTTNIWAGPQAYTPAYSCP